LKTVGTWTWDKSAGEFFWSPCMCSLFGLSEQSLQVPDSKAQQFYMPDVWAMLQNALEHAFHAGTPFEIEFEIPMPDGKSKWIQQHGITHIKQVAEPDETKVIVYGIAQDITASKQLARQFDQFGDGLLKLINSSPFCISYVDQENRYRFINKTYETWFGLRDKEIIGKHVAEVIGQQAFEEATPHLKRVFAGEQCTYEAHMPYHLGKARNIAGELIPDIGPLGVRGYYAFIRDISLQKARKKN